MAVLRPNTYSLQDRLAAFAGRWVGNWDNNPLATTSLTIESEGLAGDVTGSYVFMSRDPAKFVTKIIDNTISFGPFTFRRRPDGKLEGTLNLSGLLHTTVLDRDWGFSGRWVGIWDNNPLYTTSLLIESVSSTGDVTGSYIFMSHNPLRFATKIIDNTISFGILTFRLRPDGKLEGARNDSGLLNTTVLHRDQSPVGP